MTSEGNRVTGAVGFEFDPLVVSNGGHLVRGGQLVQAVPAGGYSWNHAHGVPYLQDSGFHGYRVATMSRNSPAVMHPHQVTTTQTGFSYGVSLRKKIRRNFATG
ncbi:hypothetical protein HanPSC8_Chr13g0547611 [Helianthus annuus]|nr:hypothetical protein HanPSC8_Chr13g0547611 [Helianthus annuus]